MDFEKFKPGHWEPKKDRHLKKRPHIRLTDQGFKMLDELKLEMSMTRCDAAEVSIRWMHEKYFGSRKK